MWSLVFSKFKTLLFSLILILLLFLPDTIAIEPWSGTSYSWQQIAVVSILSVLMFIWAIRLAQKEHFLTLSKDLITIKSLGIILLSYGLMKLCDEFGFYWLQQIGQKTTSNQELITESLSQQPLLFMLLNVSLLGPLAEELVVRGYWMKKLFGSYKWLGLLVTSLAFAALHGPSDWPSWFIYTSAGLILGGLYLKTDNLAYPIALHILNNTIASIGLMTS